MVAQKLNIESGSGLPGLEVGYNELKSLFEAGSVPREKEFSKLISYVHYLHKLLGVEGDDQNHVPVLGSGLTVNDGVLSVISFYPQWLLDMKNMLGATHVAWSDECIIFLMTRPGALLLGLVGVGFARGTFMFPVLTSSSQEFRLGSSKPIYRDSNPQTDGDFTCSSFRFWYYHSEEALENVSFHLPVKDVSSQITKIYSLEVVKFEEV